MPESFDVTTLTGGSVLRPGEDGTFELSDVAAALFSYGIQRARAADEKLAAVASALFPPSSACRRSPTMRRSRASRARVTAELSTFFNAFAGLMARATAALQAKE